MDKPFLLWSARLGGWFTSNGTYTSDLSQARAFTELEASALVQRHFQPNPENSGTREFGLIPVRATDLERFQ